MVEKEVKSAKGKEENSEVVDNALDVFESCEPAACAAGLPLGVAPPAGGDDRAGGGAFAAAAIRAKPRHTRPSASHSWHPAPNATT